MVVTSEGYRLDGDGLVAEAVNGFLAHLGAHVYTDATVRAYAYDLATLLVEPWRCTWLRHLRVVAQPFTLSVHRLLKDIGHRSADDTLAANDLATGQAVQQRQGLIRNPVGAHAQLRLARNRR